MGRNAAKSKGDAAEREAAAMLAQLLGHPVRRKLGAGRQDDEGDLDGVPGTVIQVAAWSDVGRAIREKPLGAEAQRRNAGLDFAATLVRFSRVRDETLRWRVILTPDQWLEYHRATLS